MPLDSTALASALAVQGAASSDYDLNPDVVLPQGRRLRPAAVLIVVDDRGARPSVLLTKRASHLKHHPGQIAFPGGKLDDSDQSAEDAALREAREEVGLSAAAVTLLGRLEPHETVTGYSVTPVLAHQTDDFTIVPEHGEVAEVFRAPLEFLMTPANFRVERRRWRGQWRYFYVVPWGPYYIWGATARMLKALADRVAQCT